MSELNFEAVSQVFSLSLSLKINERTEHPECMSLQNTGLAYNSVFDNLLG